MPFGSDCEYVDLEACVIANKDKENPEAYCQTLKERTEDACAKNYSPTPIKRVKSFLVQTKALDDEDGTIRAVVSTESKDRDGEIIKTSAWEKGLDEFMKNPVLLSSHNYDDLTKILGEWTDLKVSDKGLEGTARYFVNKGNAEADWGYELAKNGNGAYSVGFIAKDYHDESEGKATTRVYTDVELLEISQVSVPSNRDAVTALRSKGLLTKTEEELADKIFTNLVPKEVETEEEDAKAPVAGDDKFTTEEEASARAEEIGCEGTHTMDEDGNTIYMPCATHEEYDEMVNPSEEEEENNPDSYEEDEKIFTPQLALKEAFEEFFLINKK